MTRIIGAWTIVLCLVGTAGGTASASSVRHGLGPEDCAVPWLNNELPADDRCENWEAGYDGGSEIDDGVDVAVSPDSTRAFVTGRSASGSNEAPIDIATRAYDVETGAQIWQSRYHGKGVFDDRPSAVALGPDGEFVYVVGTRYIPRTASGNHNTLGAGDYLVLAYDARTGDLVWSAAYDGPGQQEDMIEDIALSPDGARLYVSGWSGNTDGRSGFATIAYDTRTGERLWLARREIGEGRALAVSPDGERVYVAGRQGWNQVLIAYDSGIHDTEEEQHGGELLWEKTRYVQSNNLLTNALDVAVAPDGQRVFVSGNDTAVYEADSGKWLWGFDHTSNDNPRWILAITPSPDGRLLFATGEAWTDRIGFYTHAMTVAYDAATGDRVWTREHRLDSQPGSCLGICPPIVTRGSGWDLGLAAAGDRLYVAARDCSTFAYDASTGDHEWTASYRVEGGGFCAALDVSPDGELVLTTGGRGGNYVTRAFDR